MAGLYVWGVNSVEERGLNNQTKRDRPEELALNIFNLEELIQVASAYHYSLALTKSGKIYTWSEEVILGQGEVDLKIKIPYLLTSLLGNKITKIACGKVHSLAVTKNGKVFSWGSGKFGILGNGSEKNCLKPKLVEKLSTIKNVACGNRHSLFLDKNGIVFSCGSNEYAYGATGLNTTNGNQFTPKKIEISYFVNKIYAKGQISLLITEDQLFWCGILSDKNGNKLKSYPFKVESSLFEEENIIKASCSSSFIYFITSLGRLFRYTRESDIPQEIPKFEIKKKLPKNKRDLKLKYIQIANSYKNEVLTILVDNVDYFTLTFKVNDEFDFEFELISELNGKKVKNLAISKFHTLFLVDKNKDKQMEKDVGENYLSLKNYMLDERFSDVTFIVEGRELKAHRSVLAYRSEHFSNMFESEFKESKEGEVKIDESVKFNVFRMLLIFFYCFDVKKEESEEAFEFLDLFVLADCYGLKELCEISAKRLESCLAVENACFLLNKSEELDFDFPSLSKMIEKFIFTNFDIILKTEQFKTLSKTRMIDFFKAKYSEITSL